MSVPEEIVALMLRQCGPPGWVREYRCIPKRQFRFDFAWPEHRIALEIQGGHFTRGAHTRGKGYERDLEKNRLAVLHGWKVVAFTGTEARTTPGLVTEYMRKLIEKEASHAE